MTALEKWKNDFKEFISELSMPRDDYKGIMEYINEVPNEASEQQPCKDWHDVPSDEMTFEQARQAVKDLRKKLAEDLEKNLCGDAISRQAAIDIIESWLSCDDYNEAERHIIRAMQSVLYDLPSVKPQQSCEDLINQRATTCRHGGHCEWVACDNCNHYEPDPLSPQPCEDCISRQEAILQVQRYGVGCFDAEEFSPEQCERFVIQKLNELPSVIQKEKTGRWIDIIVGDMPAQACDRCNTFYPLSYTGGGHRYCPNCGARMVEPQESEVNNG